MTATSAPLSKTKSKNLYYYGLGRRKTATARVRLYPQGEGKITINKKPGKDYVNFEQLLTVISEPLVITEQDKSYDVSAVVCGGGVISQAEAIRLGVANALVVLDPAFRSALRQNGLLTTDSRVVERKKYGLKKARKAPQYTKR
ncbi:30S ribosomal protein S9 [Candidatus Wirthbacteria bacterium CG2_30_54_11]|uniref:Small ribosomal subunit protein uS9 n=1 Tax=Candidatus Wirthbacteria bacterium CG2_30_54_11 TaxID=1817892 RepID=A0A1J5IQ08_9BACT|nr:MAG: 30S ribosomal protein S9 [Candidatus Wirthbacteria bacterium CG2_30_54_11]